MLKTLKYKGISFQIRSINELDLLGFDSYIPVFEIDREHESNWLNKSIDKWNEDLGKSEDEENAERFYAHILDNCLISCKLSLFRRVLLWLLRSKIDILSEYKKNKEWRNLLLHEIVNISTNKRGCKVKTSTAESIYYIYNGMNFADEYFKAIEKYSFNRLIYNAGVNCDNRRAKNNG